MNPQTIDLLATEIRAVNAANGWGRDWRADGDRLLNYLALIHTEITEAWQDRGGEAGARELGDVVVRVLDLGELIQPGDLAARFARRGLRTLDSLPPFEEGDRDAYVLLDMHGAVSAAVEAYREEVQWQEPVLDELEDLLLDALRLMRSWGCESPDAVVAAIVAANKLRGYRHGGLRT